MLCDVSHARCQFHQRAPLLLVGCQRWEDGFPLSIALCRTGPSFGIFWNTHTSVVVFVVGKVDIQQVSNCPASATPDQKLRSTEFCRKMVEIEGFCWFPYKQQAKINRSRLRKGRFRTDRPVNRQTRNTDAHDCTHATGVPHLERGCEHERNEQTLTGLKFWCMCRDIWLHYVIAQQRTWLSQASPMLAPARD